MDDTWDEALERLAPTGPEFASRLSNHGPMATEALVRLGRSDAVTPWLDSYLPRLEAAPRPRFRIDPEHWRDGLGDIRRVADWSDFFRRELAEAPWREVLGIWWPRLVPGVSAAATHGVIRTSHVIRVLHDAVTPLRLDELARALGYWSAAFQRLPGAAAVGGRLPIAAALAQLPLLAECAPGNVIDRLRGLEHADGFEAGVRSLAPPTDPCTALDELIVEFARVFVQHGQRNPIALVHAVTAPVAVRSVLPAVPPELHRSTYQALWQTCAGIYSAFVRTPEPGPLPVIDPLPEEAQLVERAISTGDEHAIKMTEACLRQYRIVPEPVLRYAAAISTDLLGR